MNHPANPIVLVNKPEGASPLQAIAILRKKYPQYADTSIGYAGRLDPLARGLLLLLLGDENKNRKHYERLSKIYTFTIICGIQTDTHDLMGLTAHIQRDMTNIHLEPLLKEFLGKQVQHYPLYSSARVNGKPLYYWARAGIIPASLPEKTIEIYSLKVTSQSSITMQKLRDYAEHVISSTHGEFRQREIIHNWNELARTSCSLVFPVFHCEIRCSSGTYVRKLADDIGRKLKTGALAHQITRTHIGSYSLADAIELEQ